jgi:hypothetical protein
LYEVRQSADLCWNRPSLLRVVVEEEVGERVHQRGHLPGYCAAHAVLADLHLFQIGQREHFGGQRAHELCHFHKFHALQV